MQSNFSTGIVLLRKEQSQGSNRTTRYQKNHVINSILAFLRSKGLNVEGSAKSSKSFCDIMAVLSGKPLEVKVIAKMLSQTQSRYKRSVENAGAFYVAVTNAEDFMDWYCKTILTL